MSKDLVAAFVVTSIFMAAAHLTVGAQSYEEMEKHAQGLTDVQFDRWASEVKGTAVFWSGKVVNVSAKQGSGDVEVKVDMNDTGVQDVYFDVGPADARFLDKGQTIRFVGKIKNVTNKLGLFQITLENVAIGP